MKRGILLFLTVIVLLLFGCDKKEEVVQEYEYHFRELTDAVYVDAADGFAGGDGTETNPYEISNARELAYLANVINSEKLNEEYTNCYYVLTQDITINDSGNFQNWKNEPPKYSWIPIGQTKAHGFYGEFDGCGYTIEGIYINENAKEHDLGYGLFGEVHGTIKNVTVKDAYISVSGYSNLIGTIAGKTWDDAVVENCDVHANIECYDSDCGGLIGCNYAEVNDCQFAGVIMGMKDYVAKTNIAGIAGINFGTIDNCVNEAQLECVSEGAFHMGGIVGFLSDGTVVDCKNKGFQNGKVEIEENQNKDSALGGIVGVVTSSNIGGDDYRNGDISIINCENLAEVTGGTNVAGIIGAVSNDSSDAKVVVDNCTNNGVIKEGSYASGVVASVHCGGSSTVIRNCVNYAEVVGEQVAGMVCSFVGTKGIFQIIDCLNEGSIKGHGDSAAGILGVVRFFSDVDLVIEISDCVNRGNIETKNAAAGIVCMLDTIAGNVTDNSGINIRGCVNEGDIFTSSNNTYVAGILGCLGVKELRVALSDCINVGDFHFEDTELDEVTKNEVQQIELVRISGGVVGRIGNVLYLVAESDSETDMSCEEAVSKIKITDCYSCGRCGAPNEQEYKNKYGQIVYRNSFGGIIGNYSGEEGYEFSVDDCGYANMKKGCASFSTSDIGELVSEEDVWELLKSK